MAYLADKAVHCTVGCGVYLPLRKVDKNLDLGLMAYTMLGIIEKTHGEHFIS